MCRLSDEEVFLLQKAAWQKLNFGSYSLEVSEKLFRLIISPDGEKVDLYKDLFSGHYNVSPSAQYVCNLTSRFYIKNFTGFQDFILYLINL